MGNLRRYFKGAKRPGWRKIGTGFFILLIIGSGLWISGTSRAGNFGDGSSSGDLPGNKPDSKSLTPTGSLILDPVSWVIYDTPAYLDVSGNYLYVASNAFAIVDVSDAANPEVSGQLRPPEEGSPGSFVVNGDYAYAAWNEHGLRVIDVGNKNSPSIASTFNPEPGYRFQEVRLSAPYLCVTAASGWGAEEKNWLLVIEIPADPGNQDLTLVGSFDLAGLGVGGANLINGFMVSEGFAYLSSSERRTVGPAHLHILNISTNPASPTFVGSTDIGEVDYTREKRPQLALARKGDDVYVTGPFTDYSYLKVVDVSNPEVPEVTDSWSDFLIVNIDISGDYAYVTDASSTLHILKITDPGNPEKFGSKRMEMPAYYNKEFEVKVVGDRAYLHMWDCYAVGIMDISDVSAPDEIGQVEFGHCLTDVSVTDSYACASVWNYLQFYLVDIGLPQSPAVVARSEVKGYAWGIDTYGDYAFLAMGASTTGDADSGGLAIFDINNPAAPVGHSPAWAPATANHDVQVYVDPAAQLAYVVVGTPLTEASNPDHRSITPGLRIVDFSTVTSPVEIGAYFFPAPAGGGDPPQGRAVHQAGDYAYVAADEGGLFILNISEPATPTLASQWNPSTARARSVFVRNNYAYVAYGDSLRVLDIQDPDAPQEVADMAVGAACHDVVVDGNHALVATSDALRLFNVLDPIHPAEVASQVGVFCTSPLQVDVRGDYVYVACDHGGVYIFKLRESRLLTEIQDYNGDGTSDIAVFRPSAEMWAVRGITQLYFGASGDSPASGDYNGDGTTEIGIFRPSSGLWAVREFTRAYFGASSDSSIPADYDGDGSCDLAVFREAIGLWAVRGVTRTYFGAIGDTAVPGDFSGDGTREIAVFRPSSGLWAIRNFTRIYFGQSTDQPVPGDFNGTGNREPGIFRSATGLWAIKGVTRLYFGSYSDQPVPADYDGAGIDDIGIFRGSSGLWAVRGVTRAYFGGSSDIPVTR